MSKMLSSWKELAQFFGKGVRPVQRWEKTLDLPIHRPPGAPSNVVLARVSDLEDWMHRGSVTSALKGEVKATGADPMLFASIEKLESELAALANELGAKTSFVNGTSTAPERLAAIAASIAHLTKITSFPSAA